MRDELAREKWPHSEDAKTLDAFDEVCRAAGCPEDVYAVDWLRVRLGSVAASASPPPNGPHLCCECGAEADCVRNDGVYYCTPCAETRGPDPFDTRR